MPVVLLFASLTAQVADQSSVNWILFAAKQLLLGPMAGAVFGLLGGFVLLQAKARNWTSPTFEGIGAIAMAASAYLGAVEVGDLAHR